VTLLEGFQIEVPDLFLRWDMTESQLLDILPVAHSKLTSALYLLDCVCLSGLECKIAIHFSGWNGGQLGKLELLPREVEDFHSVFNQMQEHLESAFGPADTTEVGYLGLSDFTWKVGGVRITHLVVDTSRDIEQMVTISRPQASL
jgi:hypothetical protein